MAEASSKRVTGDEPQGTMGRVVSFPPSFARTFSERRLGTRQTRNPDTMQDMIPTCCCGMQSTFYRGNFGLHIDFCRFLG